MARLPITKTLFTSLRNCVKTFNNVPARSLMSKQLVYDEFGDPVNVVKIRDCPVPALDSQQVLVRMLAAPVNPADINTIQGKYPVKVILPAIAGNEGVGVVEDAGAGVKCVKKGDKVVVTKPQQGTWRDYAIIDESLLLTIPDGVGNIEAATLTVNPCTAYRMLKDFVTLNNESVVIQNGANSACGQTVIQLCKAWNIKNVNIVRDRANINELKDYLTSLGASHVVTETELTKANPFKKGLFKKPSLALNCVGGKSSLEMLRQLDHSGKMVTYGGMSREPVCVPTSAFIFKNISCHGFWMTSWNQNAKKEQKNEMMNDLLTLLCNKKLKGPIHKMVKFQDYQEALANALKPQGFTGCKYILDFS